MTRRARIRELEQQLRDARAELQMTGGYAGMQARVLSARGQTSTDALQALHVIENECAAAVRRLPAFTVRAATPRRPHP